MRGWAGMVYLRTLMKRSVFLLLLLAACTRPVQQKQYLLAIDPRAPRIDYAESNLLIDSSGRYFYYQQPYTGPHAADEEYASPPFIHLLPTNIVQVPQQGLVDFLRLNIVLRDTGIAVDGRGWSRTVMAIGVEKDSIHCAFLPGLRQLLAGMRCHYIVRKFTEEEKIVLQNKINGAR